MAEMIYHHDGELLFFEKPLITAVSAGVRKPNKRSDFRGSIKPLTPTPSRTMIYRGFDRKSFFVGHTHPQYCN
ncbi:unnamed protein product [Adineta ricciae]|uniref:Uncharacterized protein n=1 Tax=Adineta ricciae TaxID=249248 RepID=A0A815N426_ADIRI|nr:unnamed protein product [Adineta ricciae]